MTTPKKVNYSGVAVFANGYILSRVQNVSVETDLGEEEARELTNAEVVEFTAANPTTTVSIETNEYGSMRNLRALSGDYTLTGGTAGNNINVDTFDGTSIDIGVMIEEDSVIKRTAIMNDCFVSSIAWNYDVGGVATEAINVETDNKTWYLNDYRQAYALNSIGSRTYNSSTGSGSTLIPLINTAAADYTAVIQYVDGIASTGTPILVAEAPYTRVIWHDTTLSSGTRYRTVIAKDAPDTTIPQSTSTSTIGSIPRGKLDIYLATGGESGFGSNNTTNMLRLQSLSVDVDFAREVLNELGKFRSFDRSLTRPVPVTVNFSALSSDLEAFAKFSSINFSDTSDGEYTITNFTKDAGLQVRIFDKNDTDNTRSLLKSLTVTGLQITSESFSVDVGNNATQDYVAGASNFRASGVGTPGQYPLTATPSN